MENDLISRSALMDKIKQDGDPFGLQNVTPNDVYAFAIAAVETAPAADAAKVVHGRWLYAGLFDDFAKCSVCGVMEFPIFEAHRHHYCFNCGAKMDLEDHLWSKQPRENKEQNMGEKFELLLKIAGIVALPGMVIGGIGLTKFTDKDAEVDEKAKKWILCGTIICAVALGIAGVWAILAALKMHGVI